MTAQGRCRTAWIDWSQERAANSFPLGETRHGAENCAASKQRGHGYGQRLGWNFSERGEALIIYLLAAALRIENDDLHCKRIIKVARRIVEREMAVDADSATNNVDWRLIQFRRIRRGGLLRIFTWLDEMHSSKRKAVEDRALQPAPEALRRVGIQSKVFVHVECGDPRPVDVFLGGERCEHLGLARRGGKNHANAGLFLKAGTNLICDARSSLIGHCGTGCGDADNDAID